MAIPVELRALAKLMQMNKGADGSRFLSANQLKLVCDTMMQAAEAMTEYPTMLWRKPEDITIERGKKYLVKTNGGEWGDNDVAVLSPPLLERLLKPEIVRGKPLWIAEIVDPTVQP